MADKHDKWKQNIDGRFYVDKNCIACDACVIEAPGFFEMNDDEGHAFTKKQPSTRQEELLCENALEHCPVGSIGNNG